MARTNKYTSLNFNDIYEKKIINPNNNNNNSNSKSTSSLSSSNKSYSLSASCRIHGNMLVLSRPSPKPQPPKQQQQQQSPLSQSPNQQHQQTQLIRQIQQSQSQSQSQTKHYPSSDSVTPHPQSQPSVVSAGATKSTAPESISLRPKGNTGGSPSFLERETKADGGSNHNNSHYISTSNNKFVPPHLRPGYVPKAVPELQKPRQGNHRPVSAHGIFHGSPNRFVDDGRPKSGGGYDRKMRGPVFGPGHGPGYVPNDSDLVRPRSGGSRPSSSG